MFIFGIITLIICIKLFVRIVSGAVGIAEHCSKAARVRSARRDIERNAANVQKQLAMVQEALDRPVQYKITVTGSGNGAGVPIENELRLSEKELLAQRRRIAAIEAEQRRIEKAARDKEKWEWEKEKMEWARRREAERREQLEAKRRKAEQEEKERKEADAAKKLLNKRIAKGDILHSKEMIGDIYGEMYHEIEQLKKSATAPKEKIKLLNSQAAILNKIHNEEKRLERAKYNKYTCGA